MHATLQRVQELTLLQCHVGRLPGGRGLGPVAVPGEQGIQLVMMSVVCPADGANAPLTNDIYKDDRGLLFVTDKKRGLDVIEFKG